jgi:polysaccharide biosynthesis/export protein
MHNDRMTRAEKIEQDRINMSSSLSIHFRAATALFLGVASLILICASSVPLHAQCTDGSQPDGLGCATQVAPRGQSTTGPAALSVEERPDTRTPSADSSSEASSVGSLNGGSGYTERALQSGKGQPGMTSFKPEPLSEFQAFVSASTGERLSVFGLDLFNSQHSSFNPVVDGPAPGEMIIGPDDELRIRVWGQVNFSANLRVSREGTIYLPKVGSVHVAGLPFVAISGHLRSLMDPIYRNYELTVDLGEIHSIQIYITGRARHPGAYTVSGLSTLIDAIFSSGGPSGAGSMRHVMLKRGGKVLADYDLYALLIAGDKSGDMQLQPGDVLFIPTVGPQVALLGSVRQVGIYELRGSEPLGELIEAAGGVGSIASDAKINVDRIENHSHRHAFEIPASTAGLSTLLIDGDIVRINPIVSNFKETVTLRGAVVNPGRFGWHAGMRLSELIPDRDALVKRDYWWNRTKLGLPVPELAAPAEAQGADSKPAAVASPGAQTNWNYAVIERLLPSNMKATLIPFNLGKLVLDHDLSQDLELQPSDVVTIFSQEDIKVPIREQTKYVRLEGEFVHPGIYSISPDDTLRSLVARAGGFTQQAYLYGAFFTRESTRRIEQKELNEFADQLEHQLERNSMASAGTFDSAANQQAISVNRNLIQKIRNIHATGRIVLNMLRGGNDGYELPDMHLEDSDRLEVPFTPETIQVIGAVYDPHAFLYHTGAKAGEYLHLAGSVTRDADKKRIFVLRADGSVANHDSDPRLFAHGFSSLGLLPGDSIVVPEKNVHSSAMNKALAWTQALSQSSVAALEVNALSR